jgi:hypothetical protein
MIYLISIITGLLLGNILSSVEDTSSSRSRKKDPILNAYLVSISGAILGVLISLTLLGIRLTNSYLWLEAVLWSLLGVLVLRMILQIFTFEEDEIKKFRRFQNALAHDYEKPKNRKLRK